MPTDGATRDAPPDRSEHNVGQDVQEVAEGRVDARRQAGACEAGVEAAVWQSRETGAPLGRQSSDREGLRRRPRAGLHRGHARLETRRRAPPRPLIARTVPGVRKAVKWNSPFYGVEGQGWFLGIHTFKNYVKVGFFRGTSLRPVPPGASKGKERRYLDIHEDDKLDEAQMANWVKQASQLPGERM